MWLDTHESIRLEEMAKEKDETGLWPTIRLGNIAWLDSVVPDEGFEPSDAGFLPSLAYQHRYIARWVHAEELCKTGEPELIKIAMDEGQLRRLGSVLRRVLEENEAQAANFDDYMDSVYREEAETNSGTEEVSDEERASLRAGMLSHLLKGISLDKKILATIDRHLGTQS